MASSGDPDAELRTALALLGGTGIALLAALKSICGLFRQREVETGRPFTEQDREMLLTLASTVTALEERLASTEGTLEAMTEKFDELLTMARRRRATDG